MGWHFSGIQNNRKSIALRNYLIIVNPCNLHSPHPYTPSFYEQICFVCTSFFKVTFWFVLRGQNIAVSGSLIESQLGHFEEPPGFCATNPNKSLHFKNPLVPCLCFKYFFQWQGTTTHFQGAQLPTRHSYWAAGPNDSHHVFSTWTKHGYLKWKVDTLPPPKHVH